MISVAANPSANPEANRKIVLKEIGIKWNKFSEQDLNAFKTSSDVVAQLMGKYGVEKAQARRELNRLLQGRHI
jgi:hypothetical protein